MSGFEFDNVLQRPTGRFLRVVGLVLPGVARVHEQKQPYARRWGEANRVALTEATGPIWVALGDSMTQGIGASGPFRGYVGQAAEILAEHGAPHRVVNLSQTGARVQDVIDFQLPALQRLVDAGTVPDVVTVLIGSNDMYSREHRDQLPERFAHMLELLPAGTFVANLPGDRPASLAINRAIHDAPGIVPIDMRGRTSWRGKLAEDHFHPNDLGYAAMARTFAETILGGVTASR